MWFIPIVACLVLLVIFWIILSVIYNKAFSADPLNLAMALRAHNFTDTFDFSINFMGLKYHLIIKFIVFLVCSLVTHFFDSIIFAQIVMIIELAAHLFTFRARTKEYKTTLRDLAKEVYAPIYNGYIVVTVYQVVVFASVCVVYVLNVY